MVLAQLHPGMGSSSQADRAAYAAESRALCEQAARRNCWLGLPLIAIFGGLEAGGMIEAPALFPWLRLATIAIIAAVLVALRTPYGRQHPAPLFTVMILTIGEMLALMTLSTGREHSPYFAGIALAILSAAVLMPWHPRWSVGTSLGILATYAVTTHMGGAVTTPLLFCSNCAFLVATGAIAVVGTIFRERLRWREFHSRAALVGALQHQRNFMAKMSHELRTPLHIIIGHADMLLEEFLANADAEARRLVERSRTSALALHRMISDLLDYAKVEAGKMEVRSEPVRVHEVVEDVVGSFRPLIEQKGLDLRMRFDEGLPEIATDRQRLEQILINLLGNAAKFTEAGSVSVEVRGTSNGALPTLAGFRFLDAHGNGSDPGVMLGPHIAILVRDTGIGIHESDLQQLAQDFQQVDQGATARYGGTGLGLSISRALARLLGGHIAVCSRHMEGSTFALVMPVPGTARRAAA